MIIQKHVRLSYRDGQIHNFFSSGYEDLNSHLREGWIVKYLLRWGEDQYEKISIIFEKETGSGEGEG